MKAIPCFELQYQFFFSAIRTMYQCCFYKLQFLSSQILFFLCSTTLIFLFASASLILKDNGTVKLQTTKLTSMQNSS
ncbi:hypothetical protein DICVIV_05609 [Dictyocaulus viviparus]|uniref:Uncharacterized protein n=1 Tax=Dictyocaulus viviparus TaxID=29172 RepID=A0A0D8XUX2_DICVI|nr:hypothetical protein DICVIV_05609 [Dictyocaulus viviparus]